MAKNITIKEWQEEERPREKMMMDGAKSLKDSELIAILLRTGSKNETAVDLARKLLARADNSLNTLSKFSLKQLCETEGIGTTKATTIIALFELMGRVSSEIPDTKPQIVSSDSVVKIVAPLLKNLPHEECWVLYLNRANKLIGRERVSVGGVSATIMDTRLIIKKAVEKLASAIVIVHNHPSGNPYPGEQDKKQTRLLREAAALFDIALLDHIIIAGNKHFSFSDEACV